jgi:hypothetical protein
MFRVGQEVVCVDDHSCIDLGLKRGNIYTIAEIGISCASDAPIVKLVETSPIQQFWQSRFRPIVKTDISIFTSMLLPAPTHKQVRETTDAA